MFSPSCARGRALLLPCLLAAVLLILLTPHAAHAEPIDDGLVGYWTFDEGTGSTSADATGNGNTATLVTPNSFTSATPGIDAPNPFAFAANGTATAYATAPGNGIDSLPQFTMATWFRVDALGPNQTATLLYLPNRASLTYSNSDILGPSVGMGLGFPTGPLVLTEQTPNLIDGKYHHVAMTVSNKFLTLYVDGVLKRQVDRTIPTGSFVNIQDPPNKGDGVMFGVPNNPLTGALDDVRIYNRALSGGEVAALAYNCAAVQDIPASECRALAALYANTDGANWTNHTNWLQNATACTWAGVLCNNGHVFALSLPQNNLRGALNPTLGNLTELGTLDLSNNALTGSIPFELGSLGKLLALGLGGNQFSGQIPFTLGNLAKLQSLQLQANQLRSFIPPQLANLGSLVSLDLGYNMLSAVDPTLIAFLNAHQPTWAATQTVPPTNLVAKVTSSTTVTLSWQPTTYTGDTGYYEVLAAPQATGIYTSVGKTADKAAAGLSVTGLNPNATYTFLVRTFTAKHRGQQNDLLSDTTDPIYATVDPVSPTPASATITIVLQSQPTGAANFSFTSSGFGSFVLTDNGVKTTAPYTNTKTFVVPSGTYTVAEQLVSGYLDTNISCNPPADTIADIFNNQITINAAAGAKLTCTFAVQRASQIIAGSYNDHNHNHVRNSNDEWLNGWQMELHNPFNPNVAVQPTAGEGRTTFTNLFAGKYTVCETPLTGWVNITPGTVNATYSKPCYTVNVGAGQAIWIRFGNSTSPAIAEASAADAAGANEWLDVVICALPPTDVSGQELAAETDPWELEENITTYNYLPSISRPAQ